LAFWVAYFLAVDLKRFYQFWVVYQLMGRVWQRGSNDLWQFFKHFLLFLGAWMNIGIFKDRIN
jgi:hypothetical protein